MSIELPYHKVSAIGTYRALSQNVPWEISNWRVPSLWKHTQGHGAVALCLDTGFSGHPDNCNEVAGPSFVKKESSAQDYNGHGSHIAGIVGACNNAIGVVGVAPQVQVISAKILDKNGQATPESIDSGLRYALQIKPSVVNASFGSFTALPASTIKMINQLWDIGIPVVCACGNHGPNQGLMWPARLDNVIAVGACDIERHIAPFSATGPEIDFVAPGVDILSTYLHGEYAAMEGTSMAAPFVTGLIALLVAHAKSQSRTLTSAQIFGILRSISMDVGVKGVDNIFGNGLLDPTKLFETPPVPAVNPPVRKSLWQKFLGMFR